MSVYYEKEQTSPCFKSDLPYGGRHCCDVICHHFEAVSSLEITALKRCTPFYDSNGTLFTAGVLRLHRLHRTKGTQHY